MSKKISVGLCSIGLCSECFEHIYVDEGGYWAIPGKKDIYHFKCYESRNGILTERTRGLIKKSEE